MKIALVGSAPSSVRLAPYHSSEWKIWGCSPGVYGVAPRSDAWFELHRYEPGQTWFSEGYCKFLAAYPGPVYMAEKRPEIPNSVALPVDYLVDKYGPYFFTSSLAWMMAMAIEAGSTSIGLWGVDMAACTAGDVKVLTADLRWVRADELNVGDKLLAFDEEASSQDGGVANRRYRTSEVLEASRLTKPCYRLTLEDGREIICSYDHKWLTHAENTCRWKETQDLVTPHHRDDRPSRIVKLTDVWSEDKSWEAGYLAAAFDGEGHLSQNLRNGANGVLRAGFAQRDNQMSQEVLRAMQARGFDLALDSSDGDCKKYSIRGGRAKNLEFLGSIRPRRLVDKFNPDDLGIMQKIGTVAVVSAEFIGDYPVIGLRTSTKTFIAEGLASHNTEEYGYQRAGCQYFAQLAQSMGIEVGVPPESDLFRPLPLYGVSEIDHGQIKVLARKRELQSRLNDAAARKRQAELEETFLQGAMDDLDYNTKTWIDQRSFVAPFKPKLFPVVQKAEDAITMADLV